MYHWHNRWDVPTERGSVADCAEAMYLERLQLAPPGTAAQRGCEADPVDLAVVGQGEAGGDGAVAAPPARHRISAGAGTGADERDRGGSEVLGAAKEVLRPRPERRAHISVRGKVQGVHYRDNTVRQAKRLELAGWVRNLSDGTVEIVAEGSKVAIQDFIAWCRKGPKLARVEGIAVSWKAPPTGEFSSFQRVGDA